jgi:hypothetical protein
VTKVGTERPPIPDHHPFHQLVELWIFRFANEELAEFLEMKY